MSEIKIKGIYISLIIVVIFNTMPLSVLAEEINIYEEVDVYENYNQEEVLEEGSDLNTEEVNIYDERKDVFEIIGEDKTKREKNVKHFNLSNGNVQASVYTEAVHYEKDGKWEDIDNRLSEVNDDDNEKVKENKSNSFKVKFANKATDKKLISIKSKDLNIKWSLKNSSKVKVEELSKKEKNKEKDLVQNVSSSVIYSNIMENVDIVYDINPENVKENIILKNKSSSNNKFEFVLDTRKIRSKIK